MNLLYPSILSSVLAWLNFLTRSNQRVGTFVFNLKRYMRSQYYDMNLHFLLCSTRIYLIQKLLSDKQLIINSLR